MLLKYAIGLVFVIAINITDIRSYKIKNAVVLPMIIAGLIIGAVCKTPLDSVAGMLIPLVLFPLYALRMLGAGDIKAFCAIGAMVGLQKSLWTLALAFIAGGVIALIFMALRKNGTERIKYLFNYLKLCVMSRSIQAYDFGNGEKSIFRFSYAIAAGYVLMMVGSFCGLI